MDADLQDSPDEIPKLYEKVYKKGFDLVSGWKKERYDPISKTVPTKLFNWAAEKHREYIFMISIVVSRHIIKML